MLLQHRFDLAQFNAKTSDLHLMIDPAFVFDHAICEIMAKISAAIHAGPGASGVRIRNEALGGQFRTLPISAPYAIAPDKKFSCNSYRVGLQKSVENIKFGVRDGTSDRRISGESDIHWRAAAD